MSPDERDAIFAKAVQQLLRLSVDDKAFLRSIHIRPE
jgi:hypothetical protein